MILLLIVTLHGASHFVQVALLLLFSLDLMHWSYLHSRNLPNCDVQSYQGCDTCASRLIKHAIQKTPSIINLQIPMIVATHAFDLCKDYKMRLFEFRMRQPGGTSLSSTVCLSSLKCSALQRVMWMSTSAVVRWVSVISSAEGTRIISGDIFSSAIELCLWIGMSRAA